VNKLRDTCYMCDHFAVSKEHVPPRCLFPNVKDIGSNKFRKELITVPSCDIHNAKKSMDDEILMISLAGMLGNNNIGHHIAEGKASRAIKRHSKKILNKVFLNRKTHRIDLENNNYLSFIIGTPDADLLIRSFEHIAYGIHYHHFGIRFKGTLKILMGFLYFGNESQETFKNYLKHGYANEFNKLPKHGMNQEVFYYQVTPPDKNKIFSFKLYFYQGVDVYVALAPDNSIEPFDLGIALINKGVETHLTIDNDKYVFNKTSEIKKDTNKCN